VTVAALRSPAAAPRGWIVSAAYDSLFFTGSLLLPMLLWAAFSLGWTSGVAVYVVFQLAFNMPHNFQTWTMSVLDREDRSRNGRRYLLAFAACVLVLGAPMLLSPTGVYPWVRDALVYWGYYHLVRQHYGLQRIYERKMGGVSARESFLYGRFLDAVSYLPLLLRFHDPERMTIHAGGVTSWVHHPVLPRPLWLVLFAVYLAVLGAALAHHVYLAVSGRPAWGPRALLFLAVTVCFGLAGIVIDELIVGIAVVTSFHNLQYLGLVGFHNRTRAERGEVAGNAPVGWLRDARLPLYVGASLLFGVIVFLPRVVFRAERLAELPLATIVALHYYVDARLWRFKSYPMRGVWLKLREAT
jgi:hypothetical protein